MIPGIVARQMRSAAGGGGGVLTWSAINKSPVVSLLNGDTEATKPNIAYVSVRSDEGRSAGVKQFEIEAVTGSASIYAGCVNQDYSGYADIIGAQSNPSGCGAVGYRMLSGSWTEHLESNNVSTGISTPVDLGDVLGIVVDFQISEVRFYKNGSLVLTRSSFTTLDGSKSWYPAAALRNGAVVRIRGSSFSYPIAGAEAWM